jgi:hypothetical protein
MAKVNAYVSPYINPEDIKVSFEDIKVSFEDQVYEYKYYSDSIESKKMPLYCNIIWESHHGKYIDDKFMFIHHFKYTITK